MAPNFFFFFFLRTPGLPLSEEKHPGILSLAVSDRTTLLRLAKESKGELWAETGDFCKERGSTAFPRVKKRRNFTDGSGETYKSMFVRNVVGEFQFVESDNFGHPLFPGSRAVWVNVHSLWHFRVSLTRHHPPRIMKFISTVISSYNVHQQDIFGFFIQPRTSYFKWRKHSPTIGGKRKKERKSLKTLGFDSLFTLKYLNQIRTFLLWLTDGASVSALRPLRAKSYSSTAQALHMLGFSIGKRPKVQKKWIVALQFSAASNTFTTIFSLVGLHRWPSLQKRNSCLCSSLRVSTSKQLGAGFSKVGSVKARVFHHPIDEKMLNLSRK